LKNYLRALSFLTVLPLPFVLFDEGSDDLSSSASAFPLAGATIGLIIGFISWIVLNVLPAAFVAVLYPVFSFFLTRGIHFDGMADTADGLIGTTSKEKALKAMEDSAVGVMGAVSVFLICLLKISLLANLQLQAFLLAVLFMPMAGRWAIVYSGTWYQPARNKGLGDLFLRGLTVPILLKASLGALVLLVAILWFNASYAVSVLAGFAAALASAHLLAWYASRRLGGLTGDILGAANEIGELFFIIFFYILLNSPLAADGSSWVVNIVAAII